ncbi:ABC transporter ATP-binding protein [Paenibacillus sp.]|uniref:energy-coupling factor ABC transporter ATP-binding protein n=1 Tax=Paenibacillus sp. TaxID=58172 RepID=UPI002D62A732|nr:ABC transporter ATP-binding protein [Paenibacillus sp.]HZG88394.1 ABC transporter ATP-binding protein [Paenibacillus sp.]
MTQQTEPVIAFDRVTYQYRDGQAALSGVTFEVRPGRKTAIVGGNGAGKSTAVFHMNGLYRPTSGEVRFRGRPLDAALRDRMTDHVGVVFQDPDDQIVALTVLEDVSFAPLQRGVPRAEAERLARGALASLGIERLADANPSELSYGQRKTVAIAGVLAMETEVVVFDEPMAFLDPAGKKELQRLMERLAAEGRTVVTTTHDMQLVAEWADDVIVMKGGVCLGQMTPRELFANRTLLAETKLELPPIAELAAALWTGEPADMPIRLEEVKRWLSGNRQ